MPKVYDPTKCVNCRFYNKRKLKFYPCNECVGLVSGAKYYFFCAPEQLELFGGAELVPCRNCGRKVHMTFGLPGRPSYKVIHCKCGNHLQAKVTAEEMVRRWNNKPPGRTKLWEVNKID